MKVLFAASECVPFVKTGGLADVVGALPKALNKEGVDTRVILPLYRDVSPDWRAKMEHVLYFYVNLGWRRQYCGIEKLVLNGSTAWAGMRASGMPSSAARCWRPCPKSTLCPTCCIATIGRAA